ADHWAEGGKGAAEVARAVVKVIDSGKSKLKLLYPDERPLLEKIRTIAQQIYRAKDITADKSVRDQLDSFEKMGYGKAPVCIAKTQYSFSTNGDLKGAPTDHVVNVREVRLSAGAEFVVAVCGEIMTMPGLPRVPAADSKAGRAPSLSEPSANSLLATVLRIAASSAAITGFGVPFGTAIPRQSSSATSSLLSRAVGTSGNAGSRFAVIEASSRICPP